METYKAPVNVRVLGIASLLFGLLGGAFSWWTPLGMVLSITGLMMGFVGWTFARRKAAGYGLLVGGMLLSLASLILGGAVAALGLEFIKFQSLR
jgi:hypothetical protein